MSSIKGKICIITGDGDEIQKACAEKISAAGGLVVSAVIKKEPEWEAPAGIALFYSDLTTKEGVKAVLNFTVKTFSPPSILINCPAGDSFGLPEKTDLADWQSEISLNLSRYFLCCMGVLPSMTEAGEGSIINIIKIDAAKSIAESTASSSAGGGVISLGRSLVADYAASHIRINTILMGMIKTNKYRSLRLKKEPEYEKKLLRHIPQGRLGRPEEVASLALFLAGDDSSYINGAVIPVDGGYCIF